MARSRSHSRKSRKLKSKKPKTIARFNSDPRILTVSSGRVRLFKDLVGMEIHVKSHCLEALFHGADHAAMSLAGDLNLTRTYAALKDKLFNLIYRMGGHSTMAKDKTHLKIETPSAVATVDREGYAWVLSLKTFGPSTLEMLQRAVMLLIDLAKGAIGKKRRKD